VIVRDDVLFQVAGIDRGAALRLVADDVGRLAQRFLAGVACAARAKIKQLAFEFGEAVNLKVKVSHAQILQ
jgi:hypothetical protein